MAGRIQRAFRNYMRYKHECARRIQRFWKNNKEGLVFAQVRDYGHQLLAGRKERRRFSLLGYRRFMGDYLDINGKSDLGSEIGSACSIGGRKAFVCHHLLSLLIALDSRWGARVVQCPRASSRFKNWPLE
jgi:myosin-1